MPWVNSGDYSEWVEDVPGEYVDLGGGGDQSNVVFVPTNPRRWISTGDGGSGYWEDEGPPYIPPPQPAPSYLRPEDYVAAGFTPTGQPTPEAIKVYENAVASQDIALQQTGLMQTGVAPTGIRKAPDYLPKELYSSMGYNSQGVRTGDPLIDVQDNMPSKVMAAYNNILGRNPTQAELVHHVDVFSKKPDDYQWWLGSLSESPESIQRVMTGQTNWNTVEKNARLLSQGYGFFTPTEESGFSKITNAIGGAIPFAALAAMTGGAGAAAGLSAGAAGALAGGVSNAARAAIEGGNIGTSALTGALTGYLGGSTLNSLSSAPSLTGGFPGVTPAYGLTLDNVIPNAGTSFIENAATSAITGAASNANSYYEQLKRAFENPTALGPGTLSAGDGSYIPPVQESGFSNFKYFDPITGQELPYNIQNLPGVETAVTGTGATTGTGISFDSGVNSYIPEPNGTFTVYNNVTGQYSTATSLPNDAFPSNQFGPSYSDLRYTPQAGPSYAELGYSPSLNTSPFFGFNPLSSLSSVLNNLGVGTGAGTGTGTGGDGTGGTGSGGGGPGTGPGTGPASPPFKFPTIPLPTAVIPPAATSSFYAPKGQVDYRPIIDLLGPRQILRNLF